MKKSYVRFIILDILGHTTLTTFDLLDYSLSGSHYMWRNNKKRNEFLKGVEARHDKLDKTITSLKEKQGLRNLISRMKKEGLIVKEAGKERSCRWLLTEKGEKERDLLKNLSLFQNKTYKVEASKFITLVIFDVPEEMRIWRDWLREQLTNMGFLYIQKSVMGAKVKLSDDFVNDLKDFNLFPKCVKICSVVEEGNINYE